MLFETSISNPDLYLRWIPGKFLDLEFLTNIDDAAIAEEKPKLVKIEQVLAIGKRQMDILILEERKVKIDAEYPKEGPQRGRWQTGCEIQTTVVTIRGKTFHSDIRGVEVLNPRETTLSEVTGVVVSLYDDPEIGFYSFDPASSRFEKLAGVSLPLASSVLMENHLLKRLGGGIIAGIPICGLPVFLDFTAQPAKLLHTRLAHQEEPLQPDTPTSSQPKDTSTPKKKGLFSGLFGSIKSAVSNTKSMLINKFRKKSTDPIDEEFQLRLDFGVEQMQY